MDTTNFFSAGNSPRYIKDLQQKGYAIIENVLDPTEVETALQMFHDWRTSIPNLDELHKTIDPHGIYKHHEAGHQRHAWYIRTRPKVQQYFTDLWKHYCSDDADELITSYDGSCYIESDCSKKDNYWTHTDQGSPSGGEEDELKCFQGFVALTSNSERTLVVYEGSHRVHADYFKIKGKVSTNWNIIDPEFIKTIVDKKRVLSVKAGSLVLWDSRTFHQNQYGKPKSEQRIVQYVCMLPRSHPDNKLHVQKKRRKYFDERRTTSHWPCPIRVNGKQPQTYGDKSKIIDYESLPKPQLDDMIEEINKLI
jgi:ectoine hydroxylase-related dioxygenase (phytanoyl-CoA dioxygenase family)